MVLLEPFGGWCAGADMALRYETPVKQHQYFDTHPANRQVTQLRLQQLMTVYPLLLRASAVLHAFSPLPGICLLATSDLIAADDSGAASPPALQGPFPSNASAADKSPINKSQHHCFTPGGGMALEHCCLGGPGQTSLP
eukprot:GHRQ01021809.1.p1 GENE.GHRQ01021809.1~~GHRQ01021809.1.p1  ORF type:complete len:147 (-),score=40.58 GHRQ01021809.1:94-510(-)